MRRLSSYLLQPVYIMIDFQPKRSSSESSYLLLTFKLSTVNIYVKVLKHISLFERTTLLKIKIYSKDSSLFRRFKFNEYLSLYEHLSSVVCNVFLCIDRTDHFKDGLRVLFFIATEKKLKLED